ncbi:unnamed protein product, partial [Polarella glacialis]
GINISTAGSWTLSRRQGCWRGRPQDGQLSGNFDDMLAKYEDGSMKLVDFDLTAEINICQGRKAGLAFRVSSSGRFCVFYLSLNAGSSKSSLFFRDVGAMPQFFVFARFLRKRWRRGRQGAHERNRRPRMAYVPCPSNG